MMFLTLMREAAEIAGLDPDDVRTFVEAHELLVEAAEGVFEPDQPDNWGPRFHVRKSDGIEDAEYFNELRHALETLDHFKDWPGGADPRCGPGAPVCPSCGIPPLTP